MIRSKRNTPLKVKVHLPSSACVRFTVGSGIVTVPFYKWYTRPMISIIPSGNTVLSMYQLSQWVTSVLRYDKQIISLIGRQNRRSCLLLRRP